MSEALAEPGFLAKAAFVFLSTAAVLLSLAVVFSRVLLRSATALAGVLVTVAALQLALGYELVAAVQILVYVGGILILTVFAVMLTSSNELYNDSPSLQRQLLGGAIALAFFLACAVSLRGVEWAAIGKAATASVEMAPPGSPRNADAASVGRALLGNEFALSFEILSVLLLAAAVGAIAVARKERREAP